MSEQSPILVTGAHRTGTTWVGKMLAANPRTAYISEPLNAWHRPGVLGAPVEKWYTYLCEENESAYLPAFRETLAFRYGLWREVRALRSRKDVLRMGRDFAVFLRGRLLRQRPLLKDPFAVFSTPWFAARLGCRVVVTVRHPAAFASSLKRLGWPFDFRDLLDQPLLMRDWLEEDRAAMEAMPADDLIGQAALLWRMVYRVVARTVDRYPSFIVLRHEDLSRDPVPGYRALYEALGLPFTPQVEHTILNASSSENPTELSKKKVHAVKLDSRANLDNWKKRLGVDEIERIRQACGETADLFYPDSEW
ncbi:MAG: sulfotransferase [Chloroflexota bacterium]